MKKTNSIPAEELDQILAQSGILVYWKDREKRYRGVSEACLRFMDIEDGSEIIGKTSEELGWTEGYDEFHKVEEELLSGLRSTARIQVRCRIKGEYREIMATCHATVSDGAVTGITGILEDITEEVELQSEIRRLQAVKSDFLSRVSHDLRTPVTAIMGLAELGMHGDENPRDSVYFSKIRNSAEFMLGLIDRLLDFQELNRGLAHFDVSAYSLSSMLDRVETLIRPAAERKTIRFRIIRDSAVYAVYVRQDRAREEQILVNILNNAVKYTALGGSVTWRIKVLPKDAEGRITVLYTIEDNGEGISPEYLKHIYDAFSQDQARLSRYESGAGLGLSLTKKILDLFGGTIDCSSEVGKGTTFRVTVPHDPADAAEIAAIERAERDAGMSDSALIGKRILIADDNKSDAEVLMQLLRARGAETEYAPNGAVAMQRAESGEPELILMDLRMPVVNGIESAQRIRNAGLSLPIIGLTDRPRSSDPRRAMEAGMNRCLENPPETETLLKTIRECLGGTTHDR